MTRLGHLARQHWIDVLIVVVAVEGSLEIALRQDVPQAPTTTLWFGVPAFAAVVLSLLGRRRLPFAAPAGVWILAAAFSFVDGRLIVFTVAASVAGMISAFLLGNLRDELQARLGLLVLLAGAATLAYNEPDHSTGEIVAIPMLFAIGWLAGFAVRERTAEAEAAEERAARAEREREAAARLAVAEERARIAREIHDVVAHAVSVMVLHVGTVRRKLPDELADDRDALTDVERTGRTALAEMRRLLGAVRSDGDGLELSPQPGVDRLDSLLAEVARAGLRVRMRVEGDPFPLPAAIDLSAYRIVQEGLTNVLKHAPDSEAEIVLHYEPEQLRIDVRNDRAGTSTSDGLGHGLVGIRERVRIYGGEMKAGAVAGGGFLLSTRLPVAGVGR